MSLFVCVCVFMCAYKVIIEYTYGNDHIHSNRNDNHSRKALLK